MRRLSTNTQCLDPDVVVAKVVNCPNKASTRDFPPSQPLTLILVSFPIIFADLFGCVQ